MRLFFKNLHDLNYIRDLKDGRVYLLDYNAIIPAANFVYYADSATFID